MSLITDGVLMALWERAQERSSDEQASAKVWTHLWNTHFFLEEKDRVIFQVAPPEVCRRRLVDIIVELLGEGTRSVVLAFHEAEILNAGPQDLEEAEIEASNTCMKYLGKHPELKFVYAFTSFGTKSRAWLCERTETYLTLFGLGDPADRGQYIEIHSSEGYLIKQAVQAMRIVPSSI
ncbi:uncharacterized protein CIMG_05091 [Coccidioides immitis RS]|uniref:Uncharacterized protein n=4 Tax=Coccidioides immitis TaxID=5501 RepID=A0A0E1RXG6_COCIM|nr:uncharacterized protein CIMG_05091 [Coccidioides immitis RS]KMP05287.1 hypothetical protein CIRG_04968 [Coccidioides immitis RMSCC 2394]KMU77818.1 hypothetical protein CISG_01574 [Coccidioides immitis RMSCC 3703]KMU85747.1 hypothetical protein CIHG_03787 [Coccidioides immitis H538.4]TPX21656.1 hypothetical protein DIZ76_015615 [Coccidioides immitis]EAS34067.1 hypothetical protein CIMG_05091 [Coccidioides immitis RS]